MLSSPTMYKCLTLPKGTSDKEVQVRQHTAHRFDRAEDVTHLCRPQEI